MLKSKLMLAPATLALLIAACGQKAADAADSAQTGASGMATDAAASISDAAADAKEAVTPTPSAAEFADKAAKSDAFEIAAAKLAKAKAHLADIKSFAAMMVADHTASTAKIKKAAGAADPVITPNPDLTDDQKQKLASLDKLSGDDFDREYVSQQVDAHEQALALMKLYSDHGDVPSLKAAAGEIAPKVQMHLDAIKAIKSKLP